MKPIALMETLVVLSMAYLSYLTAEIFHMSGMYGEWLIQWDSGLYSAVNTCTILSRIYYIFMSSYDLPDIRQPNLTNFEFPTIKRKISDAGIFFHLVEHWTVDIS